MTLHEVKKILRCEVLSGEAHLGRKVHNCFSADLMSDVLAYSKPHELLITGLNNAQSVRAADVVDAVGIVYVRGKVPNKATLKLAEEKNIPVLVTHYLMFEACGKLYENGVELRG